MTKTSLHRLTLGACLLALNFTSAIAQIDPKAEELPVKPSFVLDINSLLVIMILLLMIPLYFTTKTFINASNILVAKQLKEAGKKSKLLMFFLLSSTMMHAQTLKNVEGQKLSFWILVCVIILQLLTIVYFSIQTLLFQKMTIQDEAPQAEVENKDEVKEPWLTRMWTKANNFRPIEEESNLDTGHSYDGIRELDNRAPAWFTYSFLFSIACGIGYLYVYHVAKSAPLQEEEYRLAELEARKEAAAYLSSQANKIDENSLVMMGPSDIAGGQKIFAEKCAACHQAHGGSMAGGVGPNLTDDYWIHDGSLQGVFKSIKYGWPEKGMIAWKDQLSPSQMSQIASYVKSIRGSNPPGAKEPQGELYTEASPTPADPNAVTSDTTTNLK
jgi:cytochrome c oxidase cbb3-type subunit III